MEDKDKQHQIQESPKEGISVQRISVIKIVPNKPAEPPKKV